MQRAQKIWSCVPNVTEVAQVILRSQTVWATVLAGEEEAAKGRVLHRLRGALAREGKGPRGCVYGKAERTLTAGATHAACSYAEPSAAAESMTRS